MTLAKKILFNVISILLVLAIFYFLGGEIVANWGHIRDFSFNFNIPLLIISSAAYMVTFFLLALGWWMILRYLYCPVPLFETILYFFITQPAKYIPGKIWIGVARMKFCKPHGIPNSVTLLTTGAEAVLEIFAGAYISIIALLQTNWLGKFSFWGVIFLSGLGLVLLIPKIFYFFINLYLRIAKQVPLPKERHVSFGKLILLQGVYLAAMLGFGVSHLLFLQSFAPVAAQYFPLLISIGTFSYVASILAVFTPSGLGVREGVWYLALKTLTTNSIALVYAFVSRLWSIVLEALFVFIALPVLWIKRRHSREAQTLRHKAADGPPIR